MGIILEFRRSEEAAIRIARPVEGSLGEIIIFPGVRIDRLRHDRYAGADRHTVAQARSARSQEVTPSRVSRISYRARKRWPLEPVSARAARLGPARGARISAIPSVTGELTTMTSSDDLGRVDAGLLHGLIGGGDDEIDLRPLHIGAGNRVEVLALRRVERDQPKLVGNRWR